MPTPMPHPTAAPRPMPTPTPRPMAMPTPVARPMAAPGNPSPSPMPSPSMAHGHGNPSPAPAPKMGTGPVITGAPGPAPVAVTPGNGGGSPAPMPVTSWRRVADIAELVVLLRHQLPLVVVVAPVAAPAQQLWFLLLYPEQLAVVVVEGVHGNPDANNNPGKAPSVAAQADVDFGPYMADLQRRIKRAWFPPKGNESKRVVVIFKVHRGGELSNLRLDHSSGCSSSRPSRFKSGGKCSTV